MTRGNVGIRSPEQPPGPSTLLLPLDEARQRIDRARWQSPAVGWTPVRNAVGLTSARTVRARRDEPGADVAAMDGYAVRIAGRGSAHRFRVRELDAAGRVRFLSDGEVPEASLVDIDTPADYRRALGRGGARADK